MRTLITAVLVALASSSIANAQVNASYRFFGTDCQSSIWLPVPFNNLTLPRIGTTFTIQTQASWLSFASNGNVFLLTGLSRSSWNGVSLPIDTSLLTTVGATFCGDLYVAPTWVEALPLLPSPMGPVLTTLSFQIPNDAALIGARFYQQIMEQQLDPFDIGFFFTRAGEGLIGI